MVSIQGYRLKVRNNVLDYFKILRKLVKRENSEVLTIRNESADSLSSTWNVIFMRFSIFAYIHVKTIYGPVMSVYPSARNMFISAN